MFAAGLLLFASSAPTGAPLVVRDLMPLLTVDASVNRLPLSATRTVSSVAKTLSATASSPLECARAAYDWTTRNVAYSLAERHDVASTLASLSGDCDAHAAVYAALCKAMGVECVTIPGNLRFAVLPETSFASASKPLAKGQWLVSHSWNAVHIDGKWGLVDTTAGVKSDKSGAVSDDYFLADPSVFATDHVPDDAAMRFTDAPADLAKAPLLRPFAWRSGIASSDLVAQDQTEDAQIVLRPRLSWRKGFRAAVQTGSGSVPDHALVQPSGEGTELRLCPPAEASIVWLGIGSGETWRPLVGYPVSGNSAQRLPKVMARFYDTGASLVGPFDRDLLAGKPTEIRLRAPGASQVVAFQGQDVAGSFVHEGEFWVLRAAPARGASLEVMASYDDPNQFQGLLTYDVH